VISPTTVAVDLGGSWLRLAAAQPDRRSLFLWKKEGIAVTELATILHDLWNQKGWNNVHRLIVGSKGIWTLSERKRVSQSIAQLAHHVTVMSDIELAIHAALGRERTGTQGIFIVAGTGSMALGITRSGRLVREGGGGPKKGEKGSGWWIGNCFQGTTSPLTTESIRKTATLAKRVLHRASHDSRCAEIIRDAQNHLANLIVSVRKRMNVFPVPLSWGGSLMADDRFRKGVFSALGRRDSRPYVYIDPTEPPEQRATRHPSLIPQRPPSVVPPRFLTKKKRRPFSHNPTA
jgi:hypothetical protein